MPKPTSQTTAVDLTLGEARMKGKRGWRKLTEDERTTMLRMMAIKLQDTPMDSIRLAPKPAFPK